MKQIITDEVYYAIKGLRSMFPDMTVKEFAKMLFEKGITKKTVSDSTFYYIFPTNSPEEYRKIMKESRAGARSKTSKVQNNDNTIEETNDSLNECKSNSATTNDVLLDEIRHTNHLLEALFVEQKNSSRLIQQLIDLWKR